MALLDLLQTEMVAAMKAKQEARLGAIRMVKAALMKERVDSMKELDEAAEMKVLSSLIKQRREAAEMFRQGGREEQALKEEAEMNLIESFMPAAATDEQMEAAITAAIAETGINNLKQMGQVMSAAKAKLGGSRVDGKVLSDRVRAKLS